MINHTEVVARSLFIKSFCTRSCFVRYQRRLQSDSAENQDVKNNEERLKKLLENIKLKRVPLGSVVQDASAQKEQKLTGNENFVNHARAHARREALDAAKAFNEKGSKLKSIQNDLTSLCEIALGSKEISSKSSEDTVSSEVSTEQEPEISTKQGEVDGMQSFLQESFGGNLQFENIPNENVIDETEEVPIQFDAFSPVDPQTAEKQFKREKKSGRFRRQTEEDINLDKNLFGTVRLNIFDKSAKAKRKTDSMSPSAYDVLLQKDMEILFEPSVRNGFHSMIKLTKEGKLWTFPINNEQGFEEEENVPFHQHIFLERYCEHFPKHPRIQKFMKVVCLGLSKNHKLTFAKKISHIETLQHFFEERFDLLKNSADFEDEQNRI